MNGDEFLAWTIGMLRYEAALPVIPSLIALFDAGFYDLLLLLDAFVKAPNWNDNDSYSEGANFSIRCSEGLTLADSERTKAHDMGVAEEITKVLNPVAQHHLDQCEIWEARSAPGLITQVVASDVPTLLLSGAYDSATPHQWAEFAKEHLSTAWHFVFPNVGHGVLEAEECATQIMRNFLATPSREPAVDCMSELKAPEFVERDSDAE